MCSVLQHHGWQHASATAVRFQPRPPACTRDAVHVDKTGPHAGCRIFPLTSVRVLDIMTRPPDSTPSDYFLLAAFIFYRRPPSARRGGGVKCEPMFLLNYAVCQSHFHRGQRQHYGCPQKVRLGLRDSINAITP